MATPPASSNSKCGIEASNELIRVSNSKMIGSASSCRSAKHSRLRSKGYSTCLTPPMVEQSFKSFGIQTGPEHGPFKLAPTSQNQ